ncbi:PH domain-containing protein [Yarrowia sp. C11]|nr:PH domain-containing protein [Yarrowia sp. E02]KAG5371632.1 PH domain-containing protein [Yarrowia sp. C11]
MTLTQSAPSEFKEVSFEKQVSLAFDQTSFDKEVSKTFDEDKASDHISSDHVSSDHTSDHTSDHISSDKEVSFDPTAIAYDTDDSTTAITTQPVDMPPPARALASLNLDDNLESQLGQSPPIDAADYILPQYSTALFLQARVPVKLEFTSPFTSSSHRSWVMCLVTLNSTCLELKPLDEPFMVNKPTLKKEQQRLVIANNEIGRQRSKSLSLKPSISNLKQALKHDSSHSQAPVEVPQTSLAFTLQYAVCGHAADYTKRANCMRVRAESMQFLIHFGSPQDCIEWANAIQSGIDLALPLEHRELPKVRSLPRRRRERDGSASQRQRANSTAAPVPSPASQETRSRSKSTSSISAFRLLANLRRPRGNSTSEAEQMGSTERVGGDRASGDRPSTERTPPHRGAGFVPATPPLDAPLAPPSPAYSHSNASTHSHMSDDMSVHSTDSFSSDMDSATSSATTVSRSSHEQTCKERWDPEVEQMSEQAELKYATRCLKRFQRYSSWVNKITICEDKPYLVRQNFVQLVSNECLLTES